MINRLKIKDSSKRTAHYGRDANGIRKNDQSCKHFYFCPEIGDYNKKMFENPSRKDLDDYMEKCLNLCSCKMDEKTRKNKCLIYRGIEIRKSLEKSLGKSLENFYSNGGGSGGPGGIGALE